MTRGLTGAVLAAILVLAGTAWAGVRLDPPRPRPGDLFRISWRPEVGGGPWRVRFDGREFPLWPGRDGVWEGLAAVEATAEPGPRSLEILGRTGPVARQRIEVAPRSFGEQRLRVDPRLVNPDPEDAARAAREAKRIREVLAWVSRPRLWNPPFLLPARGPVSSPFGVRRVYNGEPRGYHSGLDIAAPRGTPVRAAAAGVVALADELFYTGRTVFLDHGLGLFTAYFHMDEIRVRPGQPVAAGDVLGVVGSTGRSTGPHLHWGAYLEGVKADPLTLPGLDGRPGRRSGAGVARGAGAKEP
ncbi:MAG: M23 family metallopeptidase [Deltaproteobacteria bacterium]|nr:M23 family metallopeptidase [Deltaproteobacteria bacterium]